MIDLDFICYSLKDFKGALNNVLNDNKDYDRGFILTELKSKYKLYLKAVELTSIDSNDQVINVFHFQGESIEGITELIYPKGKAKGIDVNKALELEFNFKSILYYINTELTSVKENTHDQNIIDYSDVGAKEKVIALKELGIIEYLQKEFSICQTSTNKIAEVLSLLTGEKSGTIQSYINPMINEGTSQKNNPYNNINTVEKTKNKLNTIGVFKFK